ncbi:hypothetical protein F5Y03DRAFT_395413 [Xylaria venustula]|nr:hypothetical protein F5Y03DRAFT_395413 [Xylaria venustula]
MEESKGAGRHAPAKAPVTHAPDEPLHGGPETVSDKALHTPSYNYYATPVDASRNVDRYASRPLPATPPSTVKMADRPSTSGGLGSKKTAKNDFNFDKRVSRDDFHLGARVYGGTRSGPSAPFWGRPPTPEVSPKTASIQQFASRTNHWESTANPMTEPRDGSIGVALGSPTHASNFSKTGNMQSTARPRKSSHSAMTPPVSRSSSVDTFDMPISRKPTGKWKLFSIFTKKQPDHSVPAISISDPNGLHGTNRPEEEAIVTSQAPPPSNSKNPARSNTTNSSRKAARHKPIIIRSQTMPVSAQDDRHDANWRAGEKQGGKKGGRDLGRIPITLDTGLESSSASKPLLNVEIPDVRLERYSVMFDGVLKSNPSLLSRRQATVPKLKSIDDAAEREEEEILNGVPRRATSPQPAIKPSGLALFPTSRQGYNHIPQKLSPRHRSNTSPAFLPSPSKATFDHTTLDRQRPSIEEAPSSKRPRHPSPHHERPGIAITTRLDVVERERTPSPPRFSNDQSNLILDSPSEIESEDEATITRNAWKPAAYQLPPEPKWQMISHSQKTPSTASSSYASSYRKRSPSLASSSHTHLTRASEDSDDASAYLKGGSNGAKMTPVEISIARQISVSRQQRKLLQPLHTGMPPPPPPPPPPQPVVAPSSGRRPSHTTTSSPARTSPMAAVAMSESGRIAETKTSTPTLVHPPNLMDPQQFAQHRRSERIVLEDA